MLPDSRVNLKRRRTGEDPPLDAISSPKRPRATTSSLGSSISAWVRVKWRRFEDTYHIVRKTKNLIEYLSPSSSQRAEKQEDHRFVHLSASPDMFSSKKDTQAKKQYEEDFLHQYAPVHVRDVPLSKTYDRPESPKTQTPSTVIRPTGQSDVSFTQFKKPTTTTQYNPNTSASRLFSGGMKNRRLSQERTNLRKNLKSRRSVYDKFFEKKRVYNPHRFQGLESTSSFNLSEKAKYRELLEHTCRAPGLAIPVSQSYVTPLKDSTNHSMLFGERTRPRLISPKGRPWRRPENERLQPSEETFKKPDILTKLQDVKPSVSSFKLPEAPVKEVAIDLTSDDDDVCVVEEIKPTARKETSAKKSTETNKDDVNKSREVPRNQSLSFKMRVDSCKFASPEWMKDFRAEFENKKSDRENQAHERELEVKYYAERRNEQCTTRLDELIQKKLQLAERVPPQFLDEEEEEEEEELPVLTQDMENEIDCILQPHPENEVLSDKFNITIKRIDMITLAGLNWLNDEVINFYLNMLAERGKLDNYPSVHLFNTFFYPKLMQQGHNGLKRWTRRVDIFKFDYIIIPVHLQMHWCLAMVDFRKKEIRYYDSMGGKNNNGMKAMRQYLEDESMDKKKVAYPTTDWSLTNVKNIPQQMNGSDCGMFLCKYAEYVTRDAEITFTQEDMPYFRRRMAWEIVHQTLL